MVQTTVTSLDARIGMQARACNQSIPMYLRPQGAWADECVIAADIYKLRVSTEVNLALGRSGLRRGAANHAGLGMYETITFCATTVIKPTKSRIFASACVA